jgi:hypothetical protein
VAVTKPKRKGGAHYPPAPPDIYFPPAPSVLFSPILVVQIPFRVEEIRRFQFPSDKSTNMPAKPNTTAARSRETPVAVSFDEAPCRRPTRAERLERWREQPPASVRPPEPRPRPCGGWMLGSGT